MNQQSILHASDCALHNAPALPVGPCDCGVYPVEPMSEADTRAAEDLLRGGTDTEDCERFTSRYGRALLGIAAAYASLLSATQALGAMPEGYCFCSSNRIGDNSKQHEPECAELRASLSGVTSTTRSIMGTPSQVDPQIQEPTQ